MAVCKRSQRPAGGEAELLVENLARLPIGLESIRLPTGAIQGEHELPAQALPQRVVSDQRLELADQVRRLAQGEVRLESLFQGVKSQRFQPGDLRLSKGARQVKSASAGPRLNPQPVSPPAVWLRSPFWLRFACRSAFDQQTFKAVGIELACRGRRTRKMEGASARHCRRTPPAIASA